MTCTKFQNGECDALSAFVAKYGKDELLTKLINQAGEYTEALGHCPMPVLAMQMAPMEFQPDIGENRCAPSIIQEKGGVINDYSTLLISFLRMITHQNIESLVTKAEAELI